MRSLFFIPIVFFLNSCAPAFIGGMGLGALAIEDRRTAATIFEDQSIEFKAKRKINNKYKNNSSVSVTSFNRFVLLTGETYSDDIKNDIAFEVATITNVRNIQNEIIIKAKRSSFDSSNDAFITTKVKTNLVKNKNVHAHLIKVVTSSGVVYLMGMVTKEEADKAASTAASTNGVRKVIKIFEYLD